MHSSANQPMFLHDLANGVTIGQAAWDQHTPEYHAQMMSQALPPPQSVLLSLAKTSNCARLAARDGPGLSSDARDAARALLCLSGSASDENLLRPRAPARRG